MLPRTCLTPRLNAILAQIPPCSRLCDVGTDHAYIPIAAIESKVATFAYATDVHKGPVERARENVALHGLADMIEVRLGDGLLPVLDTAPDVVVIAGMGGCLVTEILKACPTFVQQCSSLILQPMREMDVVRSYVSDKGWSFTESLVQEDRRFYHVFKVQPQVSHAGIRISDWDLKFGTLWLKNDPLFNAEARWKINELQHIEDGIVGDKEESLRRKNACREEREYLQGVLKNDETV